MKKKKDKKEKDLIPEVEKSMNSLIYFKDWLINLKQPNTVFTSTGLTSLEPDLDKAISIAPLLKPADDSQIKYREKITKLENQVNNLAKQLFEKELEGKAQEGINEELRTILENLNNDRKYLDLSNRICEEGKNKLLKSTEFRNLFKKKKCRAAIIAIDIRRSTELMLKAKSPTDFAKFISSLCIKIIDIIKTNYGVVDKFTGDRIFSFFPEFYSGSDALYFALNSANECNSYFKKHYYNNRTLFSTILTEVGLGIGVDYGETHIVDINNVVTVVGIPVVYAYRLSNAKANEILLNRTAYEASIVKYNKCFKYNESEINIKCEGNILAYKLVKYISPKDIIPPEWIKEQTIIKE